METLDDVIEFWKKYLDFKENTLSDHHYKIIVSTIKHLGEYRHLKAQVMQKLDLPTAGPYSAVNLDTQK